MKKTTLFFVSFALLLCSCEKEIEFKGKYDGSKIVLYSVVNPMDTLKVRVLRSYFILRTSDGSESVFDGLSEAKVTALVNGTEIPLTEVDAGFFNSEFVPKPGDEVTIKASREGYKSVTATTVVPEPADFSVEKAVFEEKPIEDEYWRERRREWTVRLRIRINDVPGERNYYRLKIYEQDREYQQSLFAMTQDVIFMSQTDEFETIEGMIDGDTWVYLPELIDDSMFEDRSYAFDVWFEVGRYKQWEEIYSDSGIEYEESEEPIPDLDPADFWVEVDALSPDLYFYSTSLEDYEASDYGFASFFGEKVSIHNNVQNGIGCVGAITPGIIYLGD